MYICVSGAGRGGVAEKASKRNFNERTAFERYNFLPNLFSTCFSYCKYFIPGGGMNNSIKENLWSILVFPFFLLFFHSHYFILSLFS